MPPPLPPTTASSPSLSNILQPSSATAEQERSRSPAPTPVPNRTIPAITSVSNGTTGIASPSPTAPSTSTSTPPPSPPLSASADGYPSKQMVSPRPSEHKEHPSGETERGQGQFNVAQEVAETTKTTAARSGPLSPIGSDQRDEARHAIVDHHGRQYRQHHQSLHTPHHVHASQQRQLAVRNEQSSPLRVQPPSPPSGIANLTATAAAAAAAASYTSQELAIAYSMVTSTQQQQQEKQQQRQGRPFKQAKLDQPASEDGNDALSSLWKKTTPIQEPYFQTRHTIASQHTLSTLGGVLFSLDEVPLEFTQDMYIAMRNRIFELEAKSVNYSPFSYSRKRSIDRSGLDDYPDRYGYDMESGHHSKRPTYAYPQRPSSRSYGPPEGDRASSPVHKYSSSYPSWYTPEVYTNGSHHPPHHRKHPSEQDRPYYDQDSRPPSRPSSPPPSHSAMRSAFSPPPAGPSSAKPSGPPIQPRPHGAPPQESRPPHHPDDRSPQGPPHNGPYPPSNHLQPQPPHSHHQSNNGPPPSHHSQQPRISQLPSHSHTQPTPHHQPPQLQHPSQIQHHQQPQGHGYTPQSATQQHPSQHSVQPNGATTGASTQNMSTETRQSIHQQRHRAQQQAQSAHSRSYHLHKHMRMLDQQRAAQIAAQAQQQTQAQQQQQQPQQQTQPQKQPLRPIQRHYQPHQQMYPGYNQPIPIKPHPQPPSQQQQMALKQQQQQLQQQQSQALRPNSFPQQQRMTQQQQMLQRYQQHRQLQQKQQQLRQLQYLRNRQVTSYPTQRNTQGVAASSGSHSPTPPRVFGSQVDRPIKKTTRPLECSNCMALDSLAWRPKAESQIINPDGPTPSGGTSAVAAATAAGTKILCPACTQYLQAHGKPRPVPPFRTNFLKKIHTRFKRELQEVRFQGWQDAQVLEIEDRMVEREFQMVFNGLDEGDASQIQSRHSSASGSPAPSASTATVIVETSALATEEPAEGASRDGASSAAAAKDTETIVIKIEDDDDDEMPLKKAKPDNVEVRTFQSEASVGELFGQRWRTEPVVGYTLVHFGGSDRTRMVPMNPTVPSLTVTFNRSAETITFAFRVLVNGLCLLSSGGGPPALHMPEMADDEESEEEEEEEEEVVVVPDNDRDDPPPLPPVTTSTASSTAEAAKDDLVATNFNDATEKTSTTATEIDVESVSATAASAEK